MAMLYIASLPIWHTRDTSVTHEKANYVCFNNMQPHKVKFKSVQINMKQVSYIDLVSFFSPFKSCLYWHCLTRMTHRG